MASAEEMLLADESFMGHLTHCGERVEGEQRCYLVCM